MSVQSRTVHYVVIFPWLETSLGDQTSFWLPFRSGARESGRDCYGSKRERFDLEVLGHCLKFAHAWSFECRVRFATFRGNSLAVFN
eukprot:9471892-Pyramimonas_sp.AAC.1